MLTHRRLCTVLALVVVSGALAVPSAAQAEAGPAIRCAVTDGLPSSAPACSTGPVVVARPDASAMIKVVGTSTITVQNGATVGDLRGQLTAADDSIQTRVVTDGQGRVRIAGTVRDGIGWS